MQMIFFKVNQLKNDGPQFDYKITKTCDYCFSSHCVWPNWKRHQSYSLGDAGSSPVMQNMGRSNIHISVILPSDYCGRMKFAINYLTI